MQNALIVAALAMLVAGLVKPASAMGIDQASQTELSHYRLNEEELHNFEAVIAEARAQNVPELRDGDFMSKTTSLDGMAAHLEALPGMSQILLKHGMTPRQFATTGLAISQGMIALTAPPGSAATAILGKPNPENMPFYKSHRAELMKLMDDGGSQDDSPQPFENGDAGAQALKKQVDGLNTRKMGECMKIGLVMSPIAMEAATGTIADQYPQAAAAAATPEYFADLHKQATAVLQQAETVTAPRPKRDMQIVGNELELLANRHDIKFTPRLMEAMQDYSSWMKANCDDKALHE